MKILKNQFIQAIMICFCFFIVWIYFSTSFFYEKNDLNPVTLYFNTENSLSNSPFSISAKYPVESIAINFMDPFRDSNAIIRIKFENFAQETDFIEPNGNIMNQSKVWEYTKSHEAEYVLKSPFIIGDVGIKAPINPIIWNNTIPIWAQVINVEPIQIPVRPLFKQTSFDTWDCILLLDTWEGSLGLNPVLTTQGPLIKMSANKMQIVMIIPESYEIEYSDKLIIEKGSNENFGNYIVKTELLPGEPIDIKVKRSWNETIKLIVGFICPLIIGIVLGPYIKRFISRSDMN